MLCAYMHPSIPLLLALLIGSLCRGAPPAEEWPISTPSQEGLQTETLARMDFRIQADLPHVRSLLIARHGRLVFEKYYGDASRDGLHNIQSMTKSVTSALVGIALQKGLIRSLDDRIVDYLPQSGTKVVDERMKDVTVRHLLTMSSGIDAMQLSFDQAFADPVVEILGQRLLYAPGSEFKYSSPAAHLLGGVLRKVSGRSVLEFAEAELFAPLGIGKVVWYADSTGLQSGGMSALWRSRDILKVGELYLRRGRWGRRQLIPSAYIAESVKLQNTGEFYGETARYGYMWWIASVAGHDAFYARGYGGQYLMVIPDADLVVLCTSDWKQPEYPRHFALVETFLLPSLAEK